LNIDLICKIKRLSGNLRRPGGALKLWGNLNPQKEICFLQKDGIDGWGSLRDESLIAGRQKVERKQA
jgi:hypothetical protein